LAKELASIFKTRIELRQVGVRDKAKEIGGLGPCGRTLCCTSYLSNFDSISINMAKIQNLSLNPTKINGSCGRLLCCLNYENEVYEEYRKQLPNIGEKVKYGNKEGRVVELNILKKSYVIFTNDEEYITVNID
jgi:cell fate regulator YaaT (PSP1 superfamily)